MPEKEQEAPIGTTIRGTTVPPGVPQIGGKVVSLNLAKRAYFRFNDREDFELTKIAPTARLPKDMTSIQTKAILLLVQRGELLRSSQPGLITKKRIDRIKPYLILLQQSSDFNAIKRRIGEVAKMGGNVANSGYGAREVIDMMLDQEIESHARTDVLNLLNRVLSGLPGSNRPHDEPGTHGVSGAVGAGREDFGVSRDERKAKPGSRSAREAIGRKPTSQDISSL